MSSTSAPTTLNYALPSIAAAYGLALAPYYYGLCRMGIATKGKGWDLSMPRTNEARLGPSVSKSVLEACQRARWAHVNALENFPLFAAAMLAGTVAGLPREDLNTVAKQYLGLRVLYTVLYITNSKKSLVLSMARSMTWGASVWVSGYTLWRAGGL